MVRKKMISASITKYNPIYRVNGIYTKDEWTCMSEIGECFDGVLFTKEEYLRIEDNYIQCVTDILKQCEISELKIRDLEIIEEDIIWKNRQSISIEQLSLFMKDCLRNRCWARLTGRKFFIHFGYDYYMYVGCTLSKKDVIGIVKKRDLFSVFMKSPYRKSVELPSRLRDIAENYIYVD